ncbi:hypothetical protein DFH05DRAFT_1045320 [Lentinula detonsa]|uniref:Uncharacterized protein n=1 Tax=Lentinula detonsa TaxID=2804962 RepID=A0A9W8P320_9AGAR|nr:hypothetical protein DFH05DRAFT_1045320 [Lentinula detonsa]
MVIYPLSSLRLIIILLFSTSAILDVMSIPLAGRADASSSSRRKKPSATNQMSLFLVRRRKSGEDTAWRMLKPNEADNFTDYWSIYFGYRSGFTVVCDNANVPVASPNWPWKVSPLGRQETSGEFASTTETLAKIPHGNWRHRASKIKDHLEKNLPIKGRFSYVDAVMQYLWEREIITEADITTWNARVQAMLSIEKSVVYAAKMKEIKDETLAEQDSKSREEAQGQCPNFDFNHFLNFDESG